MSYEPSTYPLVIAFSNKAEAEAFLASHGVKDDANVYDTHAHIDAYKLPAPKLVELTSPGTGSASSVLHAAEEYISTLRNAIQSVNALVSAASLTAHIIDSGKPVTSKALRDALEQLERSK